MLPQPFDVLALALRTARGLHDDGDAGSADGLDHRLGVDLAGAEVRVPVRAGVERVTAVVGVDEIDPGAIDADLVGITAITGTAPRAYELAREFRARGVPVVLGGVHPTLVPDESAEHSELLGTLQQAIAEELTPHQRRVLVALALNGVPIDVLAERLNTTRGALYKTLHDARRKLRGHLEELGLSLDTLEEAN